MEVDSWIVCAADESMLPDVHESIGDISTLVLTSSVSRFKSEIGVAELFGLVLFRVSPKISSSETFSTYPRTDSPVS